MLPDDHTGENQREGSSVMKRSHQEDAAEDRQFQSDVKSSLIPACEAIFILSCLSLYHYLI